MGTVYIPSHRASVLLAAMCLNLPTGQWNSNEQSPVIFALQNILSNGGGNYNSDEISLNFQVCDIMRHHPIGDSIN